MEVLRSCIDHRVTKLSKEKEQKLLSEEEHFHVLAVDDSLLDRKLLERLLKISSYKVTCVDSGDEALKYLGLVDDDVDTDFGASTSSNLSHSPPQQGLKVNLIMTDYCMPGMTGYDLLKRVKGSSWKYVPVVIMSSENVPSRISKCLEEGAEEFLLKPVQLSDVKNLENYFLKPLIDHYCETKLIMDDNDNNISEEDDDLATENDNEIGVVESKSSNGNDTNSNSVMSKRKAVMSPSPSQRRPNNKVKGLDVM